MANKNTESTRYYSDAHEKSVCKALGARQQSNSGAATFSAGDCYQEAASLLIECKTCMTEKSSFSIKAEWLKKNRDEAFAMRLQNHCLAFNFGPGLSNYYIIDENLMKQLVEYLEESLK
jgi:hypothetical protein